MKLWSVVKCDQKGFQVFGMIGKGIWSTSDFFSIFQLQTVTLEGTDGPSLLMCGPQFLGFNNGMAYKASGLLVSDRIHLSQRGKSLCS